MEGLKFYEIDDYYISYLAKHEPGLFFNKSEGKQGNNKRKYIGIVLNVNDMNYFVPLSSFKSKHKKMKDNIDFIEVKDYAVLNLNKMIPVPMDMCKYVDINRVGNQSYRYILLGEYRHIKSMQRKIRHNAELLYNHKVKNKDSTALAKRCNDFLLLEKLCREFK